MSEADALTVTKVLDCRRASCPMPVVKTAKAIQGDRVGQLLKMIATTRSKPDLAAWSRQTGHELVSTQDDGGKHVFIIRRTK